ncbi:tetratricopeptide repeat protein [Ktedonobacter robiniae]|uniref:tetratricopeptide repeat protein n=1 Tax=Ktedonobacter robiniae TaxID=2778365 RepID=UPI003B75BBDE
MHSALTRHRFGGLCKNPHVLRIREQQLGDHHPEVANALHNLAILYFDQGKLMEAQPFHQRALSIREQYLESEPPQTAP